MKNTSFFSFSPLLVLVLLSTITSIAEADAPTESCNSRDTLSNDQWQQVSLPCVPAGDGSVTDVFGDDMVDAFGESTPLYGINWVVYGYDLANSGYIKLAETDTLNVGVGYWIIQQSGSNATLDLPANSTPAPATQSDACLSDRGCFEIPLKTKTNSTGWNMIGRPGIGRNGHFSSKLGDARIQASNTACADGCGLYAAQGQALVHSQLWTYSRSKYVRVKDSGGDLQIWRGYWAATLESADGKNPKLLIQQERSPPVLSEGSFSFIGPDTVDLNQFNTGGTATSWSLVTSRDNEYFPFLPYWIHVDSNSGLLTIDWIPQPGDALFWFGTIRADNAAGFSQRNIDITGVFEPGPEL